MVFVKSPGDDLGKVFAVRRRRPTVTEIRCTQRSSSVTDWHEDGSIPTDIQCVLPLLLPSHSSAIHSVSAINESGLSDVSTNVSSARYSWSVSSAREASDPSSISIAGPPIEVAIARLLAILQAIYGHGQHKADLDRLTSRLHRLVNWYLWSAATARDPFEQSRMDSLVRYMPC
ncbi:hypothetical protein BDR06DRAFT_424148 [Suillus hirtellus]|nr:hypothetical protein BDR06DRAFT_424148 [Suillus hirtellus]